MRPGDIEFLKHRAKSVGQYDIASKRLVVGCFAGVDIGLAGEAGGVDRKIRFAFIQKIEKRFIAVVIVVNAAGHSPVGEAARIESGGKG